MKLDGNMDDDMMDDESMHKCNDAVERKHSDCNMMTMKDVACGLSNDFGDEIADSKKYLRMAKIAEDARLYSDSHYLLEMARDEYTHARFIHRFMDKYGMCIPEDLEERYKWLEDEISKFF